MTDKTHRNGRRGPQPLTSEQHRMRGTQDIHKIRATTPYTQIITAPVPPSEIQGEALDEWHRVAPLLVLQGLITEADTGALAVYCQAYANWRSATRALNKMRERDQTFEGNLIRNKSGNMVKNPAVEMVVTAQRLLLDTASAIGLTHASRMRLQADTKALAQNPFAGNERDLN